jgi:hypothetical protein
MRRFIKPLLAILLLLPLVGSCYLPNQFEAEIRVMRSGDFSFSYNGVLVYAPLYVEIASGKLSPEAIKEKTDLIVRDLKRDSAFTEVVSLGRAHFRVKFKREDRAKESMLFTFIRRNAVILTAKWVKDGTVLITGTPLGTDEAVRIRQAGLQINGTLKVVSDYPRILENNSQTQNKVGFNGIYTWKITDPTAPMPKIRLAMR